MVMVMKNKLQKHHKSKAFFIARNFSFALIGLVGVGLSIAIPTYISSLNESNITTKAKEKVNPESGSEEANDPINEIELASIR